MVPWTRPELEAITRLWARGYKQAWKLGASTDSAMMLLSKSDGGRGCPSATEVWVRDVLDLQDQCIRLPGEISQIAVGHLRQVCHDWGCNTLDQAQKVIRLRGGAKGIVELLLQRLDEWGLSLSSPWILSREPLLVEVICRAWWRSGQMDGI